MSKSVYKSEVCAKVNLSLEITGKTQNLHTLKMLVCPYAGFKDEVEFYPKEGEMGISEIQISASFDGFDKDRFVAFFMTKAQSIAQKLNIGGRLVIRKGVPLGAGLGGSTASIVASLKAMSECAKAKFAALDDRFLLELGSDVPCMLYGKSCLVEGVGDIVKPVDLPFDFGDLQIEIASGGSDTKSCYALYDELKAENCRLDTSKCLGCDSVDMRSIEYICLGDEKIELFKNDLTLPATTLNENIRNLIIEKKKKYKCVFMSGSGSAVVFKN